MTSQARVRVAGAYRSIFVFVTLLLLANLALSSGNAPATISEGFLWRSAFISAFARFRFSAGDRVFRQAVVGSDGWIFYTAESSMKDFQRLRHLSRGDLRRFTDALERVRTTLSSQGRKFLLVVSPNKSTVYARYMPDEIPVLGVESSLDQIIAVAGRRGQTGILDLRTMLMRESLTQQTYYRTDTHWNQLGAYYAYVAIMNALKADYAGLAPHPIGDFEVSALPGARSRDLPRLMGGLAIREPEVILVPRFPVLTSISAETLPDGAELHIANTRGIAHPTLLVVGDSFYGPLEKFLGPHFARVTEVLSSTVSPAAFSDLLERERPDIVIIECVERQLVDTLEFLDQLQP